MKNVVIGASGQVARALRNEFAKHGESVVFTSSKPSAEQFLNLSDLASIDSFFAKQSLAAGAHIYLVGALTHVDRCETEQALCRAINVLGPVRVGEICAKRGYKLCYFSSEYVYGEAEYQGGRVGPFLETDPAAPTSYYGASKLEAEQLLQKIPSLDLLVIRTTMVFSFDQDGMNYFMQLFRHLQKLERGEASPTFKIPVDQISTPTYAPALAQATIALMQMEMGIFHVVGEDCLSRKAFLERICQEFGFSKEKYLPGIEFLETKQLGQAAKRPLTAGLSVEKAKRAGVRIWNLAEAFQEIRTLQKS